MMSAAARMMFVVVAGTPNVGCAVEPAHLEGALVSYRELWISVFLEGLSVGSGNPRLAQTGSAIAGKSKG